MVQYIRDVLQTFHSSMLPIDTLESGKDVRSLFGVKILTNAGVHLDDRDKIWRILETSHNRLLIAGPSWRAMGVFVVSIFDQRWHSIQIIVINCENFALDHYFFETLVDTQNCHDAYFVDTGVNGSCRFDNPQCRKWRQNWSRDNSRVIVNSLVHWPNDRHLADTLNSKPWFNR